MRPPARQGAVPVGHGGDASPQGNLVPSLSVGITGPVERFVVILDDFQHRGRAASHLLCNRHAARHMGFDFLELVGAERAASVQQMLRNRRLSQVLQAAGQKDIPPLLG